MELYIQSTVTIEVFEKVKSLSLSLLRDFGFEYEYHEDTLSTIFTIRDNNSFSQREALSLVITAIILGNHNSQKVAQISIGRLIDKLFTFWHSIMADGLPDLNLVIMLYQQYERFKPIK